MAGWLGAAGGGVSTQAGAGGGAAHRQTRIQRESSLVSMSQAVYAPTYPGPLQLLGARQFLFLGWFGCAGVVLQV